MESQGRRIGDLPKSYERILYRDPMECCGVLQQKEVSDCGDSRQLNVSQVVHPFVLKGQDVSGWTGGR